jgi:hypothetical protein
MNRITSQFPIASWGEKQRVFVELIKLPPGGIGKSVLSSNAGDGLIQVSGFVSSFRNWRVSSDAGLRAQPGRFVVWERVISWVQFPNCGREDLLLTQMFNPPAPSFIFLHFFSIS